MRVTLSAKVRVNGFTAGDLKKSLVGIPEDAKVSIYHYKGDPRDQRETPYTDITFTWTEERNA
jgi:hypothetical protein